MTTATTTTPEPEPAITSPTSNIVLMENGTKVDFGKRSKYKTQLTIKEEGFSVLINFINGKSLIFDYKFPNAPIIKKSLPKDFDFICKLAGNGAIAKIVASFNGISTVEKLIESAEESVKKLESGIFPERGRKATFLRLTILQQAYAIVNNLPFTLSADIQKIKDVFNKMGKDKRLSLSKELPIKIQVGKIHFENAQANLLALEQLKKVA